MRVKISASGHFDAGVSGLDAQKYVA